MASEKVLIVGGGGREHALAWALARPQRQVLVSPGNAGIARDFECRPAPGGVAALARELAADLVVVGPEQPLVEGLADELREAGFPVLGPTRAAAALEGSKAFMKDLCAAAGVPTAAYGVFEDADDVDDWLDGREGKWVVKADGLCAGKGVTVCSSAREARVEARRMLEGAFGEASSRVVVEAFLPGREVSVLGLCDGEDALLFAPARDHKPLFDDDQGPNTGGMGAVAPLGERHGVTGALLERVRAEVMRPILSELKAAGAPYRGILYAGLMLDGDELNVLEFNCRFGDPEAQAVLFGTAGPGGVDLYPLFAEVARGERLPGDAPDLVAACRPTCAVVLASEGYPSAPVKGRPIALPDDEGEAQKVFFAGVKQEGEQLLTHGGRVLAATAQGETLKAAVTAAYALADEIQFEGRQLRRDIGKSVVEP